MKKIISILISIVLTVSVFTTAYATSTSNEIAPVVQAEPKQGVIAGVSQNESAIVQEMNTILREALEIAQDINKIIGEEYSAIQDETGDMIQEEGAITQTEYKAVSRETVIQYARELVAKYSPKFLGKTLIFPVDIVRKYVDRSITFLQARRGEYEAEIARINKLIDEVVRACRQPILNPIMDMIMMILIMTLSIPRVFVQSGSAQFQALIEAKQRYNYRLNGRRESSVVAVESVSK